MNPWLLLVVVLAWGATVGGAFFYGEASGEAREKAGQKSRDDLVREIREAGQQGAAAAIAQLKPRNVTIKQELEREIQTNTIYRDCRVPADGVRLANDAIAGGPQPAGGGQLPAGGAAAAGP